MDMNQSCGFLIKQIHTTLEKNANNTLKADGLTSAQAAVLLTLLNSSEKKAGLKELEQKLHLAQSTVAGTVSRLHQKGFLIYCTEKEDKRMKSVQLTDAGEYCCQTAIQRMNQTEDALLSRLTETEKELFLILLQKVSQTLL